MNTSSTKYTDAGRWAKLVAMMNPRLLLALVCAVGCTALTDPTPDPFAGCYDRSCADTPQLVAGLPALVSITSKFDHTCGLTAAGEAWCWGVNTFGQLGDGSADARNAPVKVAGSVRFTSVSVGAQTSCGLGTDGTMYCWGSATTGILGPTPLDSALTNDAFACGAPFIDREGRVARIPCARAPYAVAGGIKAIAAGLRHVCALDTSGVATCWGLNSYGEVGRPSLDVIYTAPQQVPGSHSFASIYAGDSFTCGLTTDARAWCWGEDDLGQLGDAAPLCNTPSGFAHFCSPTPLAVRDGAAYSALSLGAAGACATTGDGTAHCWGDPTGLFNPATNPARAQTIEAGMKFTVIHDASSGAMCGTPMTGASVCWGINVWGRLGVGQRAEVVDRPTPIVGGRRFVAFASGTEHVCALTADGATYCWGSGRRGQLGAGARQP